MEVSKDGLLSCDSQLTGSAELFKSGNVVCLMKMARNPCQVERQISKGSWSSCVLFAKPSVVPSGQFDSWGFSTL
jgi:hypothetical protein